MSLDTIAPTPERARHAGRNFEAMTVDKQMRSVKPARVVPRFERMHDAGRISKLEAEAGIRFERDMELASRATVTASYGQRHAEGTPVSQQTDRAAQEDSVRRVDWYGSHKAARAIVGKDWPWFERFLTGESLDKLGGKGRKQASIQRATAKLRVILATLAAHYWPHLAGAK